MNFSRYFLMRYNKKKENAPYDAIEMWPCCVYMLINMFKFKNLFLVSKHDNNLSKSVFMCEQ